MFICKMAFIKERNVESRTVSRLQTRTDTKVKPLMVYAEKQRNTKLCLESMGT
jgi:hypothetical protein